MYSLYYSILGQTNFIFWFTDPPIENFAKVEKKKK